MAKHKNIGSSFDVFLEEDGILQEAEEVATKRVVAFQIKKLMQQKNISKTKLAKEMKTSRSSLDRLLDPTNDAGTLKSLHRAARALGKKLEIRLI
ncbi:MAG: helix-turn-helix domain-containing protein [Desulfobacterales bacterium]|nr:helix-turn-helix domain-containing protein [Desulfobacterales bacterium]